MLTELNLSFEYVIEFKTSWSQTNDLKIYTCRYLAWHPTLLGNGKEQWNEENQLPTIEIYPA